MKKILIVNNNMHIGGVQKALMNLLWSIRGKYDITLLLFYKTGEYLKDIPPEIKVITANSAFKYLGMTRNDTQNTADKLGRSIFAAIARVMGRKYAVALMGLSQERLGGYDVAISYLHNAGPKGFYGGCNDFVLKHTSAKKKVAFLHCDYQHCGADTPENAGQYAKFDAIAACSQGCADSFLRANPQLTDKLKLVYNCHCFDKILKSALSGTVEMDSTKVNLITVARMGIEKSVHRAIEALGSLDIDRNGFHYYVIGDGIQRPLVEKKICEFHLEEQVTLLGELDNPYGHLKAADLMLIPSISEAAPMVIGEAAFLGTPILSTETSSAREMITDTGYGWVCSNSAEGIAASLGELLRSPEIIEERKQYLKDMLLNNDEAVAQFAALIEDKA